MKVALAVGAHPDDIELGAAGLLLKLREQGWDLYYVAIAGTNYEQTEVLLSELDQTCKLMRIKEKVVMSIPNTRLPDHTHQIRDKLGELAGRLRPGLVLIPSVRDTHQDHAVVALESIRTFRSKETILSYELHRHGSYLFSPNVFVDIEDVIERKLEILSCYKTQLKRAYFTEDVFRSMAIMRGAQVGIGYAEAFEAVKVFLGISECGLTIG